MSPTTLEIDTYPSDRSKLPTEVQFETAEDNQRISMTTPDGEEVFAVTELTEQDGLFDKALRLFGKGPRKKTELVTIFPGDETPQKDVVAVGGTASRSKSIKFYTGSRNYTLKATSYPDATKAPTPATTR